MLGVTTRRRAGRDLNLTHQAKRSTRAMYNLQTVNTQSDADRARLPSMAMNPLQVTDPTSSQFGAFYFLPDFSVVDGGDILT
jgi:hypothetical protein